MNSPVGVVTEFEAFWRPFIRVVQLCCASNYKIFHLKYRKNSSKYFIMMAYFAFYIVINMSLVSLATVRGLQCEPISNNTYKPQHKESALMYYVNSLTALGNFITHLTVHSEAVLCGEREMELFEKIKIVDTILTNRLKHQLNYKDRRRQFLRKIVSAFMVSCILCTASSFSTLPEQHHDKYFMQPILILGCVTNRIRWCYVAIVSSCVAETLNDLQILLRQNQIKNRKESKNGIENSDVYDKIRYIREIYSTIWCIIALLSDCYGWTLITFLLSSTLQSINASYWLYINMSIYKSMDVNLRKIRDMLIAIESIIFSIARFHFLSRYFALHDFCWNCFLVPLYAFGKVSKNGWFLAFNSITIEIAMNLSNLIITIM